MQNKVENRKKVELLRFHFISIFHLIFTTAVKEQTKNLVHQRTVRA